MLVKGWKKVANEPFDSQAMCICSLHSPSVGLPCHWYSTLAKDQFSQSDNRTCMLTEKRMRETTINNREGKSYVQYTKQELKNSGLPKGGNAYGNGVTIVGCNSLTAKVWQPDYRFKHTAASDKDTGSTSLEQRLTYDREGKCTNAYKILIHSNMLLGSYGKFKSKPGNMTAGTDKLTLDGISIKYIDDLHDKLKNESWIPQPSKRIYIEKANGKKRPLGIPSPRDKIVQESMRKVLENVLEPKFLDCSHGFRPSRGCHSALKKIRYWNGIKWFIEGDIKSFFDEIDHHVLESLLKKHFRDQQFIDLYWKMVRAGYVEFNTFKQTSMGTPQGSIISPILSNVYLHELDMFIESERIRTDNAYKKTNQRNKEYEKLDNRIQNITKQENILKARGEKINEADKTERIQKIKERRLVPSTIPKEDTSKIYYVRYADDWIIGARGSYEYVENLKNKIKEFLQQELKLTLSPEKTLITDAFGIRPAVFLGTRITRVKAMKGQIKNYRNKKGHQQRISGTGTFMTAPIETLINKMITKGLAEQKINRHGEPVYQGKARSGWQNLPTKDIVVRYKSILNGILNYYSFVDNKSRLNIIYWILKSGLVKTIATKLKLKSMKKVFAEYATNLERLHSFECPSLVRSPKDFKTTTRVNEYSFFDTIKWNVRTRAVFREGCRICGALNDIEMHHLKHIKTINIKLKGIDKEMAAINRKQIPICKNCHAKIHRGEYDGIGLRKL